jgi:cytoskeletal protein CcmA (bactofilin family)
VDRDIEDDQQRNEGSKVMRLTDTFNTGTTPASDDAAQPNLRTDHIPALNQQPPAYKIPRMGAANSEPLERQVTVPSPERIVSIGSSVVLKGDIENCDRAEIKGTFEGTIKAVSISIAEGGRVNGTIDCEELTVAGSFEGKATSTKALEVKTTGKVVGDVVYKQLVVTAGGVLTGALEKLADE